MLDNLMGLDGPCETKQVGGLGPMKPTVTQILRERKAHLENQLKEVNEAISALTENPQIERCFNLVAKASRY